MTRLLLLVATLLLAAPVFAQPSGAALSAEREAELREAILAVAVAPDFDRSNMQLELYRTLKSAGVKLSTAEMVDMAEQARKRGLPGEAVAAASPMFPDGVPIDEEASKYQVVMELLRRQAAADLDGDLAKSVEAAGQRVDKIAFFYVAQAFAGIGQHERAIELYERSIVGTPPLSEETIQTLAAEMAHAYRRAIEFYLLSLREDLSKPGFAEKRDRHALILLNLGISLYKLDRVVEAREVWIAIKDDGAAGMLAKVWIDLADASRN